MVRYIEIGQIHRAGDIVEGVWTQWQEDDAVLIVDYALNADHALVLTSLGQLRVVELNNITFWDSFPADYFGGPTDGS